ncbi:hypothetical protein HBI56_034110 [Parastagonospora nodorum]|nr:hypothetical protein HBH53_164160 [Parastagonospora nodorum]KAH3967569.1 hypothetical protein HBH51_136020 [Parastagonospora nodorum]KAH4007120.1 hypothetical protein HBI10_012510 [Parastagonospora nodorum]KAH4011476.1 hypothetical protein HBI13_198080 [Parastagonospora nodorum]KAH4034601.1 hypothetical protein HBI09_100920 [Parastagonospora nodorum]
MSPNPIKTTIWLWPSGLYPRRIIYFLLIKKLALSTLAAHNIHLIPIHLSPTGLISATGLESRPAGTSVPLMRLSYADGTHFLIHETSSILEYLQEIFPGGPDIRGETVHQRARSRDVLSLLGEAIVWYGVEVFHSDPNTATWSGLRVEDQSPAAAAHGRMKVGTLLDKLEGWVREDVEGKGAVSLVGGEQATLADLALVAPVEYFREKFGADWIKGHGVLETWYGRMKEQDWVAGGKKLAEVEETGDWELVLGA